jgi:hypothetical protein
MASTAHVLVWIPQSRCRNTQFSPKSHGCEERPFRSMAGFDGVQFGGRWFQRAELPGSSSHRFLRQGGRHDVNTVRLRDECNLRPRWGRASVASRGRAADPDRLACGADVAQLGRDCGRRVACLGGLPRRSSAAGEHLDLCSAKIPSAPGSPRPIPDGRQAPTPAHGRSRSVAPA